MKRLWQLSRTHINRITVEFKECTSKRMVQKNGNINRITVEFKASLSITPNLCLLYINRITVEFKVLSDRGE